MLRLSTILLLLLLTSGASYGQVHRVTIGGQRVLIKQSTKSSEYGDSTVFISLYKLEVPRRKYLLTHTLREIVGDCNSISLELGTYRVTDSSIILYSYWAKAGDAPVSPFGVRKQIYQVREGRLKLVSAFITVHEPQQSQQSIERLYNGRLIKGKRAIALRQEVKKVLSKEIYRNTRGWEQVEAYKAFGIFK